jgi:hypothetical protein
MGKRSGTCDRPGIPLETSDSAKTELNLGGDVASVGEINTTLKLQQLGHCWFTRDAKVSFLKRKKGWTAFSFSDPIWKAFEEYGIIHQQAGTFNFEHTLFPSLKAARQAVNDVSLEVGLNIASRLTRQHYVAYKIGDLPLRISRNQGHWRIIESTADLSPGLKENFRSIHAFNVAWAAANITLDHPTRKAAHQAVLNWLAQTIAIGK